MQLQESRPPTWPAPTPALHARANTQEADKHPVRVEAVQQEQASQTAGGSGTDCQG